MVLGWTLYSVSSTILLATISGCTSRCHAADITPGVIWLLSLWRRRLARLRKLLLGASCLPLLSLVLSTIWLLALLI